MSELNKRIAELRGEGAGFCNTSVGCVEPNQLCEQDKPCQFYTLYKPYTTDMRYAMELWDEMKVKGSCTITGGVDGALITITIFDGDKVDKHKSTEGNTEAEAICKAYVKWKEGAGN